MHLAPHVIVSLMCRGSLTGQRRNLKCLSRCIQNLKCRRRPQHIPCRQTAISPEYNSSWTTSTPEGERGQKFGLWGKYRRWRQSTTVGHPLGDGEGMWDLQEGIKGGKRKGGKNYSISQVPPASSICFLISSASDLPMSARTTCGADSTNFLACRGKKDDTHHTYWKLE